MDWIKNWKHWRKLKLMANLKSFYFKILNNIATWQISEECKCGEIVNNFWYLLECQKLIRTKNVIINKIVKWTQIKPQLEKSKIIKLTNNTKLSYINVVALWRVWNMRNKMIFENIPPNDQYAIKFTASILKRLLNLHFNSWNLEKFKRF